MDKFCTECGQPLPGSGRVFVNVVLDESGSMYNVKDDTIGALQQYVDELRKDGNDYHLTVTKFSTEATVVVEQRQVSSMTRLASKLDYRPNGGTALYDAIGKSIREAETDLRPGDRIITVILTDGYENSSRTYNKDKIKTMIEARTERGNWTFVYLSADIDTMAESTFLGVAPGNYMGYAKADGGTYTMSRGLASATTNFASSNASASLDFFDDGSKTAQDTTPTSTTNTASPKDKK
jgi:hypothetical protein